jgi:16S rRNA (guanine1207-N2)-methyltransferase
MAVTAALLHDAAAQAALEALFVPFADGALAWPANDNVAFLRARAGVAVRRWARPGWLFEQGFRPFATQLERDGYRVGELSDDGRPLLVLVLPPRQREESRALLARAFTLAAPGATVVTSVANAEGARSAQDDLAALADGVTSISKHKCRVCWATVPSAPKDAELQAAWLALDAPREILDGAFVSRPGLFAWDRVDAASVLLAQQLPAGLTGDAADLGAGFGYLSCVLLQNSPALASLTAFEAEARALPVLARNLARYAGGADAASHWHDVTTGIPGAYDTIVSNPPFHQGRADQPLLGQAFIDAAAGALRDTGSFWLVANRHLPYEQTLGLRFTDVQPIADRDGFKVIRATGVRR